MSEQAAKVFKLDGSKCEAKKVRQERDGAIIKSLIAGEVFEINSNADALEYLFWKERINGAFKTADAAIKKYVNDKGAIVDEMGNREYRCEMYMREKNVSMKVDELKEFAIDVAGLSKAETAKLIKKLKSKGYGKFSSYSRFGWSKRK